MISEEHSNLLKKLYYHEHLLFGRDKLFQYVKNNYENYPTRRQVMQWLKTQAVHQIHQRPQGPRLATKLVIVQKPNRYFQCDLTGTLPRDQGYNYIFAIIDIHSKKLYTAPLKSKTSLEVANALNGIIVNNKLDISVCQMDNGTEFHGFFQELLREYNIKQIFSQAASPWTNGVIERSHGTWKQMLYKYWSISNTKKWKDILPILTKNYNNSFHRSIGMTPTEASLLPTDLLKKRLLENAVKIAEPKVCYEIGDKVRVRLRIDNKLEKAKQYFTNEIYSVKSVIKGSPTRLIQYQLKDKNCNTIKGFFNESDLLDANTSEKPPKAQKDPNYILPLPIRGQVEVDQLLKNKDLRPPPVRGEFVVEKILDSRQRSKRIEYLIKWSGYPKSMASWEPEENLKNAKDLLQEFNQINRDPKVEATRQKWLNVISEYTGQQMKNFPKGFTFKSIPRKNNPKLVDYYLYIDETLVQPKNSVIRSVPDLKRYLDKLRI
jgi:hypothetical protein